MLVVGLRVNFLAIHATVIVLYEWNVSCQMARETVKDVPTKQDFAEQ